MDSFSTVWEALACSMKLKLVSGDSFIWPQVASCNCLLHHSLYSYSYSYKHPRFQAELRASTQKPCSWCLWDVLCQILLILQDSIQKHLMGGLSGRTGTMPIFPFTKQQLNRMLVEEPVLIGYQSINLFFFFCIFKIVLWKGKKGIIIILQIKEHSSRK